MINNMVGLEAEFFLTDKDNQLLFPGDHGFETDSFIILGEVRADPGYTRIETVNNFMAEWYAVQEQAKSRGKVIDTTSYREVDLDFWSTILKRQGRKDITQAENIYGTDITQDTDAVISRNKITGHRLSIGLHLHFSSFVEDKILYTTEPDYQYEYIGLPVTLNQGELPDLYLELYKRTFKNEQQVKEVKARASRLTRPDLTEIVTNLDDTLFKTYKPNVKLKFRKPGFYQLKRYGGFEYRSLPFNSAVLDDLYSIVDHCFNLLEDLDL